jgi:hypothetical protein
MVVPEGQQFAKGGPLVWEYDSADSTTTDYTVPGGSINDWLEDNPIEDKYLFDSPVYKKPIDPGFKPQQSIGEDLKKAMEGISSKQKVQHTQPGNYPEDTEETNKSFDFSRYAPVAANIGMALSDLSQKAERVDLGRINPHLLSDRQYYNPQDTQWMMNKLQQNAAATRAGLVNSSSGNATIARSSLLAADKNLNEAIGKGYLDAQQLNRAERNRVDAFNLGVNQQNMAARNAAAAQNQQISMQEKDINARNEAARRNAIRSGIIAAAEGIGGIGKENYFGKTAGATTNYYTDPSTGNITFKSGKKVDKNGNAIKE